MTTSTVGLVGVGAMGSRMAPNLREGGFELVICDVVAERAAALAGPGVEVAPTPRAVAERASTVITMLPSLQAIEQAVLGADGLAEGFKPGSVLIEMSTSLPTLSRRLGAALAERGVQMLDSPVSGTTPAAEAGTLVAMVGGDPAVLEACRAVLAAMCSQIHHCGSQGQGNAMKLALNLLIYLPTLAGFETLALAAKCGLDLHTLVDVISSGSASSYIVEYKLNRALERDFVPGGSFDVAVKDLELALDLAHDVGVPLQLSPLALQTFSYAKTIGMGGQDTAALITLWERLLGLEMG
jgi:3-hydroxyisobutyrate dehydrogenase-like beta-hydroxyacid dehydrogenase